MMPREQWEAHDLPVAEGALSLTTVRRLERRFH